ncbi:hypothetical protein SAMN02990966_00168 [Rhodospirillales bacterium URHD0017]|nr:hypothetical protein SAMN02990966_00168 [Rhodospirillales bacterium URHD0017]
MDDWEKDTAIKVTNARRALERGELRVPSEMEGVQDVLNAPLTPLGLVDISKLSKAGVAFGRMAGMAASVGPQLSPKRSEQAVAPLDPQEAQFELFRLFALIFAALTGVDVGQIGDLDEVRTRLIARVRDEPSALADSLNKAASELAEFYSVRSLEIFRYAKGLGGMKVVAGGQRQFTEAGLDATRISGLYIDTQLIPDPVYPFLADELALNAKHLQLAHVLYFILQLQPLVDARLPVPAIVVFPSFEEPLEKHDPVTQVGIESLLLQVVAPICDANISAVRDLFDYAVRQSDKFLSAVMNANLFVPQGHEPGEFKDGRIALNAHIASIEGRQAKELVDVIKRMPPGAAALLGIMDRLRPQFHLLENSNELQAQPLMALPVQWHYFNLCATASARELVNKKVLSEANFVTLRALQDDSVSWLANIPIEGLLELRRNAEVVTFREELKKYTSQLAAAGPLELNDVVKEVNHGLASLVQRHAKAMEDVRTKYRPKMVGIATGAVIGAVSMASMAFLPALASVAGVVAPVGAMVGVIGGGSISAIKEIVASKAEQRQLSRHSLLGMLASARKAK